MFSIYFFENQKFFNAELKNEFLNFGLNLDYEMSLHKFFSKIKNFRPNIVVLDYENPIFNTIFSEALGANSEFFVPCVLVLSDGNKNINLPNSFVIKKGEFQSNEINTFLSNHYEMMSNNFFLNDKKQTINQNISKILVEFDFSNKLNGTIYLKDCLRLYVNERMRFSKSVSLILEKVALVHETKPSNVDRCLRSLISSMWQNNEKVLFNKFFKTKPSTKELIRTMAEYVLDNDAVVQKIENMA